MSEIKPVAITLMGPTASGKTALAQALCDQLPCDIINVDSAQFYKGMDIGSAKPSAHELAKYPHRLLDFLDPAEHYSAAQFQKDALLEIEDILSHGRIPLLVGGSMMYFKVLVEGLSHLPNTNLELRAELQAKLEQKGTVFMHRWLSKLDPKTAQRLHFNDQQRILRALEICLSGDKTMSQRIEEGRQAPEMPCQWKQLALFPERRDLLHQRIEKRFKNMIDKGFVCEVERLYQRSDLSRDMPALRAVGYRQIWEYLEGELSYENMIERGIIATRQFAKRQYTWLRGWKNVQLFDNSNMLLDQEHAEWGDSLIMNVVAHLKGAI